MNNKIIPILKNINFWGLLICNLAIGRKIWGVIAGTGHQFELMYLYDISFYIFVILAHFFLFKKVNFAEKTNWKLALYSLFSSVFLAALTFKIHNTILFGFEFDFVVDFVSGLSFVIGFVLGPVYVVVKNATLLILFASIVNFIWFYREKQDRPPAINIETEESKRIKRRRKEKNEKK